MVEILKIVGQYGGFSAIVAFGLAWVAYKFYTQLVEIQNARVKESNDLRTEMLTYSTAMNQALEASASAMAAMKDAIKDTSRDTEGVLREINSTLDGLKDSTNTLNSTVANLKDMIVMEKNRGA